MLRPHNFTPLQPGTPVKEVDKDGKPTGTTYYSARWNTRLRPAGRTEGCPQWIDTIVVGDQPAAAQAGKNLVPPAVATVASSSPVSRDVLVIHVDDAGQELRRYVKPYLFVPSSRPDPSLPAGEEIAQEIWFCDERIVTPEFVQKEQACNTASEVIPGDLVSAASAV